jgi:zinc transporter 1
MKFSVQNRLSLIIALAVCFIIGELAVGFTTRSLSLVADAFHYIGDVLSFCVALWADKVL